MKTEESNWDLVLGLVVISIFIFIAFPIAWFTFNAFLAGWKSMLFGGN